MGLLQQLFYIIVFYILGQLFQLVSLFVDVRLFDKLRIKIWGQEYVDFGLFFIN